MSLSDEGGILLIQQTHKHTQTHMKPSEIPPRFATHADLSAAYTKGFNHGHGFACNNVPKLGDRISPCVDWVGLGKVCTAENIKELHELLCFAAEENSRQYSPFEFTASEFNQSGEGGFFVLDDGEEIDGEVFGSREEAESALARISAEIAQNEDETTAADVLHCLSIEERCSAEELWEAFEEGTRDAIGADLATYTEEDYGIPVDPWEETPDGFADFWLPEYWASYLINGDASGLEESELAQAKEWEASQPTLGGCVDCSESEFRRSNDANSLGGNCSKFRFPILTQKEGGK